MAKTIVSTKAAPGAIGPYSQAVASEGLVFCSGQVGLDPATGRLVEGSVGDETRRALDNLTGVLEAAGVGLDAVVKVTAFLTDMGSFSEFNDVYGEYFSSDPPARATVGVAALPAGAHVEVECIARL